MRLGRRDVAVVVGVVAFGVVAALVKGDNPGIRGQIGNLSAPWVLVGLLPATRCTRMSRGAVVGVAATLAALVAFYVTLTLMLAGHLGGGGFARELLVELRANRIYLVAGLLSGPVAGGAGAWLARRSRYAVALAAGALATLEIAAVYASQASWAATQAPVYFRWGVDQWTPYIVESVIGLTVVAVTLVQRSRRRAA